MDKLRLPTSAKRRQQSWTKLSPANDFKISAFAVIVPQESANDGPDLLGRWGAGTEIGTALFGTELEQFNTVCIKRTSQLRYRRSKAPPSVAVPWDAT